MKVVLMQDLPFISANVPKLSSMKSKLLTIEEGRQYSNYGPTNTRFETHLRDQMFGGVGSCLTVCNATIGLMIAIKQAARVRANSSGSPRYALMPAFTFAAAAQAALWAGYTPLFCDIDPATWAACPQSERRLIEKYHDSIDVIVPYATFGYNIDLDHYENLHRLTGAGIVVDAAASLGSLNGEGSNFGTGFKHPIVYSMHATKPFGIGEGGVIYCADPDVISTLREMGNFGFGVPRSATMPGLNSKLTEVAALVALERLDDIEELSAHRQALADIYRQELPEFLFQPQQGQRRAYQFMPTLIPDELDYPRAQLQSDLSDLGIKTANYFSPHLMEQPYFANQCKSDELSVTNQISGKVISLPLWSDMTEELVREVALTIKKTINTRRLKSYSQKLSEKMVFGNSDFKNFEHFDFVIVGGGPAGLAPLLAAAKSGDLPKLLEKGLCLIERSSKVGAGRLGKYIITSDSSAATFLSCIQDCPVPELAELVSHPIAMEIASAGIDCIPLTLAASFMDLIGETLTKLINSYPSSLVLTDTELTNLRRREDGSWSVNIRLLRSEQTMTLNASAVLMSTGAIQSQERLCQEMVSGKPLLPAFGKKLVQSDDFLSHGIFDDTIAGLENIEKPHVVIVGGSTSAMSCARHILRAFDERHIDGRITMLHRNELKVFYPSVEAASSEGYTEFNEDDICPLSGFVHRFGGFRFESRMLAKRLLGIGNEAPELRVTLYRLEGEPKADEEAWQIMENADLIVACLGYRPSAAIVLNSDDTIMPLQANDSSSPMVNDKCSIMDQNHEEIPGLFGIGLAAGFRPPPSMGGERSFNGQVNGLWLWQNDVGRMVAQRMIEHVSYGVLHAKNSHYRIESSLLH
ncbi:DegT/DnrJ/EryC1/StrS family aminotransferase [Kozakia baliensis]|uniref:DegT/DnrJ/EryC1/StrS family aminotransferase n=1 Tax=Kozakia baliensis TaxID=153496 RepID=UPI00136431FF|nr:DegT/DnrJ/EryC1/StrS family aminotransferase [Kozakia baliensis]